MKSLHDVPAPAKLNLFLHITGRRPDGYHLLQSVFMLIDWCDQLHFEKRSGGAISREDLTLVLPEQDLIMRAAQLLQKHTGCTEGVHIAVAQKACVKVRPLFFRRVVFGRFAASQPAGIHIGGRS